MDDEVRSGQRLDGPLAEQAVGIGDEAYDQTISMSSESGRGLCEGTRKECAPGGILRAEAQMGRRAGLILCVAGMALAQTQDKGVNFYSIEREMALGDSFAAQFRRDVTTATDQRLDDLGNRLASQALRFRYRFFVFDDGRLGGNAVYGAAWPADWGTLNIDEAIAVAAGTVFVPRKLMGRADPELAAILAHAIGHVELRHATRALTRRELMGIALRAAAESTVLGMETQMDLGMLKVDWAFEMQADLFAVQLLRKAGFDPQALVSYLRSLPAPARPAFSMYPLPEHRAAAAEKAIAELK
jgi:predicted Zn-dependent protease